MLRHTKRFLPALATAGVMALAGGSFAAAHDDHHKRRGGDSGHHARCDKGRYSAWDEQSLMTSIEGDRFEIAGGRIAQNTGQNPKVKALGARLIEDHTKSLQDAVKVAKELGIDVPDSPSPSMQWELKTVAKFTGNTFDRAYADLEVLDHKQDIKETSDEISDGCNHQVRENAKSDLPVLQQHLALSRDAQQTVGSW